MTHTKEFLISELHRFVHENGRVPKQRDMSPKNGYPSYSQYIKRFGTFNKGINNANLIPNRLFYELDGTETCAYCGCSRNKGQSWYYDKNGIRYCMKHGGKGKPDYVKGTLDINSNVGIGRAGEICVIKTLEIGKEFDCNRKSCHYSIDMYNEEYGKIDVKTALFGCGYNNWRFIFPDKPEIKTFICLGLSSNRSDVKHVWIVPNNNNKRLLSITNSFNPLLKNKKWEVDAKPYNNTWKTMKLDSCKIMIDKSKKEQTQEEKQKNLQSQKELIKRLGLKGYEEINGEMVFKLKGE